MKAIPARAMRLDVFSRFSKPSSSDSTGFFLHRRVACASYLNRRSARVDGCAHEPSDGFSGGSGAANSAKLHRRLCGCRHLRSSWQYAAFRAGFCSGGTAFCRSALLASRAHRHTVKKDILRAAHGGNPDSGFSPHYRLDSSIKPADWFAEQVARRDFQFGRAAFESLQHSWHGVYPGSLFRSRRFFYALRGISGDGSFPRGSCLYLGSGQIYDVPQHQHSAYSAGHRCGHGLSFHDGNCCV